MLLVAAPMAAPPAPVAGAPFDAAPFALPLQEGVGLVWEDPREIHRVVVRFRGAPPPAERVRLEYWGSRWPDQRLPKDREPGGGDVGWWELGNWYQGGWRRADTTAAVEGDRLVFTFNPLNREERPDQRRFDARYRYTLKLRLVCDDGAAAVDAIEAFTDSVWQPADIRLAFRDGSSAKPVVEAFNGQTERIEPAGPRAYRIALWRAANPDPNTFDQTLLTVRRGKSVCTVAVRDLQAGPILVPSAGLAVSNGDDARDYASIESALHARGEKTLYDRVAEMPEQTWRAAWEGMPAKRGRIYLPLGLDGGRQRFQLHGNGSVVFRTNDHYLRARPGKETPRLDWEASTVQVSFGMPREPVDRTLMERTLPIGVTTWEANGAQIEQIAFVAPLEGFRGEEPPPPDTTAVFLARFVFRNPSPRTAVVSLRLDRRAGDRSVPWQVDADGFLEFEGRILGQVVGVGGPPTIEGGAPVYYWQIPTGAMRSVSVKLPYVPLSGPAEREALGALAFDAQMEATAAIWRRRLDRSARLITPEPMLNEFYRAHAAHLLINCEKEPGGDVRFARVGSFAYGAYGNESCMMVVDLDRRGYHEEARQCLDAWLKYQGTAPLPGDFSDQKGVLYGAGGYEAGGYNQHHGWILWCLAEHYRFTRDRDWLQKAAPGILEAAEWIVRERKRTAARADLGRGLLPAGSLEDIGDWWFWLSTNAYTWRGLDAAAWAMEQLGHPDAARLRKEADAYRRALLAAFRSASQRSPVVRLRDGVAVPHIPSHVHRRGRCFGWICETLEGALHLLITGALDARSPEAEWILKDYEDNRYLSNQYGYVLDDFDRYWFGRGGMSMQACLLFHVEPYLYRDDVKQALRGAFNAIAVSLFPDVCMQTEHALPSMGDWRGDHFKSSDEANAAGWLRQMFVRESGSDLLVGQAVPESWLAPNQECGIERASTYFGPMSVLYRGGADTVTATLDAPTRNAPRRILLRFRLGDGARPASVTVNGKPWTAVHGNTVELPGSIGHALVVAKRAAR